MRAWTGLTWKMRAGTPAAAATRSTSPLLVAIVLRLLADASASALLPLATTVVTAVRPVVFGWVTVRGTLSSFASDAVSTVGASSEAPRPNSRVAEKVKAAWRDP